VWATRAVLLNSMLASTSHQADPDDMKYDGSFQPALALIIT
jgi:hypothetical protein